MQPVYSPVSTLVPIAGDTRGFPVRRVHCVARNYADHAREMGASGREPPFFFAKPADAVIGVGVGEVGRMPYPPKTAELHHEVELVVAIGRTGCDIPENAVLDHIFGYAVGLDMTRRDIHTELKKLGRPWELAKAFDGSAPVGTIATVDHVGHLADGAIRLEVNGIERQRGQLSQMIWSVAEIVSILSSYVTLCPGDLIFTGTPAGVGPVSRGDSLIGSIDGLPELRVDII